MDDNVKITETENSKPPYLDLDKVRALKVLGRGATGTVFLSFDPSASPPAPPFALKVVLKRSPTTRPDTERRARWELAVLSRLRHPLLPSLLASADAPDLLAWATPFCSGGDLNVLRHSLPDRSFSVSALRFYLSQLVQALSQMHSMHIAFRDLKPENVLLRANGHLVLTDFDLSRQISISPSISPAADAAAAPDRSGHRRHLTRIWPARNPVPTGMKRARSARISPARTTAEMANSFVGTEEYVAPEIVRGEGHDFAVDWWALGILAYEMAYGKTPFKGRNRKETFRNVLAREPEFPNGGRRRRTDMEDLIARLLEKDRERRLGGVGGAGEVRKHPFFAGVQWDLVTEVARPPYIFEEEMEAATGPGGEFTVSDGFDIREYFSKLRAEEEEEEAAEALSMSLDEF